MKNATAPVLGAGTIGAREAVERALAGNVQLVDATWVMPEDEAGLRGALPGTAAVLPTHDIKAIAVADRTPERLADLFRAAGMTTLLPIAVYDRAGLFSAAWGWWMLQECGYTSHIVQGWTEEGAAPAPSAGDWEPFVVRPAHAQSATLEDVLKVGAQVVDARGPGRFQGTEPEPRPDLRGGHIPGSTNVPYHSLKEGDRFLAPAELFDLFTGAGLDLQKPLITTCGSGVTASALAFCLARAGAPDVRVYMGSWAEYGASDHPVETGP